jgi:hypothetical protein
MNSPELAERPAQVTLAIRLILVVIAIGIIQAAILVFRHIDVRSPDLLIMTKLAIYAFGFFLVYRVARGDNWARWLMAVILFIAIPIASWPTLQAFTNYPFSSLLEVVSIGLYVGAIVLLFGKSASAWFTHSD